MDVLRGILQRFVALLILWCAWTVTFGPDGNIDLWQTRRQRAYANAKALADKVSAQRSATLAASPLGEICSVCDRPATHKQDYVPEGQQNRAAGSETMRHTRYFCDQHWPAPEHYTITWSSNDYKEPDISSLLHTGMPYPDPAMNKRDNSGYMITVVGFGACALIVLVSCVPKAPGAVSIVFSVLTLTISGIFRLFLYKIGPIRF